MKKVLAVILAAVLVLSLGACGSKPSETPASVSAPESSAGSSSSSENSSSDDGELEVDKGLLDVTITIPTSMFGEEDIDTVIAEAKEKGFKNVIKNDDGTVTYKMSKSEHTKAMKEMRDSINDSLDNFLNNEEITSIKKIEANDNFNHFTVIVDKEKFNSSLEGFSLLALPISAMYYQAFDGTNEDELKCVISVQDEVTGEIISETEYPDAFEIK